MAEAKADKAAGKETRKLTSMPPSLIFFWRVIGLLAVAAIPLVPALVSFVADDKPLARELDDTLINGLLGSAILPIIVLILATPIFGNEIED